MIYGPGWFGYTNAVGTHSIINGHNANVIVSYNRIYGGGYGCVYKDAYQTLSTNACIYRNLFSFCSYGACLVKGAVGTRVYNNTVLTSCTNGSAFAFEFGDSAGATYSGSNGFLFNNLIYCDTMNSVVAVDQWATNCFHAANNLYWNRASNASRQSFNWGGLGVSGFSTWALLVGEINSKFANPLMCNVTNIDCQLQSNSPAINMGLETNSIDLLGRPVRGKPDAGAYEYQLTITRVASIICTEAKRKSNINIKLSRDIQDFPPGQIIMEPSHCEDGHFLAHVYALGRQEVTVEASTDLVHWIDLATVLPAYGDAIVADTNAGAYCRRFYRLKP